MNVTVDTTKPRALFDIKQIKFYSKYQGESLDNQNQRDKLLAKALYTTLWAISYYQLHLLISTIH